MTSPEAPDSTPPSDAPSRARQGIALGGLVIVAAIIGAGLWLSYQPGTDQLQGMVDADEVNAAAKITGRVAKLYAREGDHVAAGQPLYAIDSPEVAAREQQALGSLESARAVEDKARAGARPEEIDAAAAQWRRAQAAAELARTTYQHTDTLFREGVLAQQKRDEALANMRASTEAAKGAQAQYQQARTGARPQDIQAAGGQVRQAQGAVAEVRAARADTTIRAPVAGEINKRLADIGEIAQAGYPVFTITDTANQWVSVAVREDQLGRVKPGSVLRGEVPALGVKQVAFRVYFIAPAGDYATWRATRQSSGYDVKSFQVRLRPVQATLGLRPGMSVLFAFPQ